MRDIEFVDNVFNSPYEHALAICRGVAGAGIKARLQTVELNPKFMDEELLRAMEEAGFVAAGITAESASDEVLSALGKGFNRQDVYNAARVIGNSKIPFLWIFLLGGPGETDQTVRETLSFAENNIRRKDTVFFNIGIRIYPGAGIDAIARQQGLLDLPAGEMLRPVSYLSPLLDKTRLLKTVEQAISRHLNFIGVDSLSLPYLGKIYRLGHLIGTKPPIWKHTRMVRFGLKLLRLDV
jgi:radical SAM superfamily enzyme YgiQ (UPF0313 family)